MGKINYTGPAMKDAALLALRIQMNQRACAFPYHAISNT